MEKYNSKKDNIVIVGLGYVGLTLAAKLSQKTKVFGIEKNKIVLEKIKNGEAHFYEEGIDEILYKSINNGTLKVYSSIIDYTNVNTNNTFIITIGTPNHQVSKLSSLFSDLLEELNPKIKDGDTFILRSTVSIGTSDQIHDWFLMKNKKVNVCFCPERTVEGKAIKELSELPQIISSKTEQGIEKAKEIFKIIDAETILASDCNTAELAKLTSNIERDVYFGFANQMNFIAKSHGVSFGELRELVTYKYERSHLKHTAPVGGPCLEKDTYILKQTMKGMNHLTTIIDAAREFNESWADNIYEYLDRQYNLNNFSSICLTGLSFKGSPMTDDLRGTLALDLFNKLKTKDIPIYLYDRHVKNLDIINYFKSDPDKVLCSVEKLKDNSTLTLVQNGSKFAIEELISNNISFLDLTSFQFGEIDNEYIF